MKSRSCRLGVELMEGRDVPSAVAYGDFNHDGRADRAAITSPTTVAVSVANPDGSYAVAAVLTAPKKETFTSINVADYNGDGTQDVYTLTSSTSGEYIHKWMGNGDGTFGSMTTEKYRWPFGHVGHGGTW